MKKYVVYYRYRTFYYADNVVVKAFDFSDAVQEALEMLEELHQLSPEDVDICHIEEVED